MIPKNQNLAPLVSNIATRQRENGFNFQQLQDAWIENSRVIYSQTFIIEKLFQVLDCSTIHYHDCSRIHNPPSGAKMWCLTLRRTINPKIKWKNSVPIFFNFQKKSICAPGRPKHLHGEKNGGGRSSSSEQLECLLNFERTWPNWLSGIPLVRKYLVVNNGVPFEWSFTAKS